VLFEPGWKLREAIKVFWTIPVTLRGLTPRIIVADATRCNSPRKCPAISEQLSFLEKETGIAERFFIQPLGAASGSIFRQRSFVEFFALGKVLLTQSSDVQKGSFLLFLLRVSCCRQHSGGKD
jgi:hypothetical protein